MKVGMVSVWDKWGMCHATTVLQLDDCRVIQVKKEETDGYTELQLGVGEAKAKRVKEPMLSHMKRWGDQPAKRKLMEFRVTPDALLETGTLIQAMHFVPGQVCARKRENLLCYLAMIACIRVHPFRRSLKEPSYSVNSLSRLLSLSTQLIDVCGTSKGKGFAGVMKRWNFRGGDATHGNSLNHRTMGSTGNSQDPGRVWKGKKMPGRLGSERVTTQNLFVLKVRDPALL
jgi:large subunit ribosomal protein L3